MAEFDLGSPPPALNGPSGPSGDDNIYAGDASSSTRGRLRLILLLLLAVGGGTGLWWYLAAPHNAADQLARADAVEKDYLADKATLAVEKAAQRAEKVRAAWRAVFEKFPAEPDQAVSALRRLSEFETFEQRPAEARKALQEIIDGYPRHEQAARAAAEILDSLTAEAGNKAGHDALELYEQAVSRCGEYRATFSYDPQRVREMAARACRLVDDKIAEPPIRAIRELEGFLDEYAAGPYVDEMLYRLARRHQMIGELAEAERLYTRLIDEFPQSDYLRKAEFARADVVGELDPERGEKLWRELAEKYADDPDIAERAKRRAERLAVEAEQKRKDAIAEEARSEMSSASRGRYGSGGGPGDMGYGKPIPPREMLADFIEQKLDAQSYAMNLVIDPETHTLANTGSLTMVNGGDEKNDFLLMLSGAMEIHSLSFDGKPVRFNRPGDKDDVVQVLLDAPWPAGASGVLNFDMTAVTNPLNAPGALPEKVLESLGCLNAEYALAPVARDEPAQTPDEDISAIATRLSQMDIMMQINETGYAINGAAWYPVTMIGDLFTSELHCEMPAGNALTFSGRRDRYEQIDGRLHGAWVCEKPMFALYFAYGPFQTRSREAAGRTITVMLEDERMDMADEYLDTAAAILEFYSERFGAYPFSKLDIIQVDLPPILGGVGPAGMILLHSSAVRDMDHAPVYLLAHEMSHHWWGNLVPINMIDGRYNQWLSEGFATYSDAMFTAEREGPEPFDRRIREMARLYLLAAESGREEPIMKTFMGQNPFYRQVVYEKGALVLHALRYVLGDDRFMTLLKDYAARYAFTPSTVDDFVALTSEIAGRDMEWFFNEWLELTGCPLYDRPIWTSESLGETAVDVSVEASDGPAGKASVGAPAEDSDRPAETWELTVTLSQPDRLSQTPMDLFVHGEQAGQMARVRFEPASRTSEVKLRVDFPVKGVTLDDELKVLHLISDESGSWSASRPAPPDSF